jgi:hypothetical protein
LEGVRHKTNNSRIVITGIMNTSLSAVLTMLAFYCCNNNGTIILSRRTDSPEFVLFSS